MLKNDKKYIELVKIECYNYNIGEEKIKKEGVLIMAIIELNNTITGESKAFEVVEKEYILRTARLFSEEEAEEVLLNEYEMCGENIRYDLCINMETGSIEIIRLYEDKYIGFKTVIPIISLDVRRGNIEFFSWIDDELEGLKAHLDLLYKPVV